MEDCNQPRCRQESQLGNYSSDASNSCQGNGVLAAPLWTLQQHHLRTQMLFTHHKRSFQCLAKKHAAKKENRFRIARAPPNPENTSRNMMWRRHKLSRQSLATAAILACGNKLALKAEQMFWSSATAAQEIACRMLIAHKGNIQAARLGQL